MTKYEMSKEDQEAAKAMDLPPMELSASEKKLLSTILHSEHQIGAYLLARNFLIRLWHQKYPTSVLSSTKLADECQHLVSRSHVATGAVFVAFGISISGSI
jgi:hypothetical protein